MSTAREKLKSLTPKQKKALLAKLLVEKKAKKARMFPVSYAQQRLWFLDQMAPGSAFYNVDTAVRLPFRLNVTSLEKALSEIVRRHEALRTTFKSVNGKPVQMVAPPRPMPLPVIDLTHLPAAEREAQAKRIATEEAQKGFDLAAGPLMRTKLLKLDEQDFVFLLTMHHIISDGWSLNVFSRELTDLYGAFDAQQSSPLADLPIQYPDFALWQRKWLQGGTLEQQLHYWREKLADLSVLNLPTDRPRPLVPSLAGAFHYLELPERLIAPLRKLGKQESATLFMVLLAAFKILLARYAGQLDIVVGSPVANRNRAELEGLIGFFVNMLVMRTDLSGDPSFREVVQRVRETALGAYGHQDLPFERLVEELQPDRDLSKNPLFQVSFQVFKDPGPTGALDDEESMMNIQRGTANIDLGFDAYETGGGVAGRIEYSTELFEPATIARMMTHFEVLLEGIVANPDARLSALPLITPAERAQLLVGWNATTADFSTDGGALGLFEQQVEGTPDAVALVSGSRRITYRQLDNRANALAHRMIDAGLGRGDLVALYLDRSVEFVTGMLAALKAGGAYLPVDPESPRERIALVLRDSGAALVLTTERRKDKLPDFDGRVLMADARQQRKKASSAGTGKPDVTVGGDDLAYVIYTSGSTGIPKGVEISHAALCNQLVWMQREYPLDAADCMLHKYSVGFDVATLEVLSPLIAGARLVIARPKGQVDMAYLADTMRDEGVTVLDVVPSQLRMLLEAGVIEETANLRRVVCGGEALPPELARAFHEQTAAELSNQYGPTEAAITATHYRCQADEPWATIPIGKPIANTHVYVLDASMNPVPIGVPGELYIGGACLARGYRNRPDLTASQFIESPFPGDAAGRLYKTGDLVRYLPDGNLEFLRRVDHQVKVRGFRIELGEIETRLKEHPAIDRAVVVDLPEDTSETSGPRPGKTAADRSNVDRRLVAYIVPAHVDQVQEADVPGAVLDDDQVARWREEYEEIYSRDAAHADPTFNTIGWDSSYTGMPLSEREMREQVDGTAERLLALKPKSVLEIGCGTGLLLFPIAPDCERYVGTDCSATGLRYIEKVLEDRPLPQVDLMERPADDFDGFAEASFDAVMMNSVVQYFPSAEYLMEVLRGAARIVRPGGHIFLGDVRNLDLLETFHSSVEVLRAPAGFETRRLDARIRRLLEKEEELVIDWRLFQEIRGHVPEISQVQVQLKRGQRHNELTCFRYDVILKVGGEPADGTAMRTVRWGDHPSIEEIGRFLKEDKQTAVRVNGIPNARLARYVRTTEILQSRERPPSVGDLRERGEKSQDEGIEPEALWALADDLDMDVCVTWSASGQPGQCDALFRRRDNGAAHGFFGNLRLKPGKRKATARYTTHPLQVKTAEKIVPTLPGFLRERLPEYMVPSAFAVMGDLPLTASGKVDREALPEPQEFRPQMRHAPSPPRNDLERKIARAWEDVLNLESVGTNESFFDIGGHSLLIVRLHSRLRDELGTDFSVIDMFQYPTVAALAKHLAGRLKPAGGLEGSKTRGEKQVAAMSRLKSGKESVNGTV